MKFCFRVLRWITGPYHECDGAGQGRTVKRVSFKKRASKRRTSSFLDGSFPAAQNNRTSTQSKDSTWEENERKEALASSATSTVYRNRKRLSKKKPPKVRFSLSTISETYNWQDTPNESDGETLEPTHENSYNLLAICNESTKSNDDPNNEANERAWEIEWDSFKWKGESSDLNAPTEMSDDLDTATTGSDSSNLTDLIKSSCVVHKKCLRTNPSDLGHQNDSQTESIDQTTFILDMLVDSADPIVVGKELHGRLEAIYALKTIVSKQGETVIAQRALIKRYRKKRNEHSKSIKTFCQEQALLKERISHLELEVESREAKAIWSKEELQTVRTELCDIRAGFCHKKEFSSQSIKDELQVDAFSRNSENMGQFLNEILVHHDQERNDTEFMGGEKACSGNSVTQEEPQNKNKERNKGGEIDERSLPLVAVLSEYKQKDVRLFDQTNDNHFISSRVCY